MKQKDDCKLLNDLIIKRTEDILNLLEEKRGVSKNLAQVPISAEFTTAHCILTFSYLILAMETECDEISKII